MTHDVFGFGVAGRLLMQQLDARHALAFFGRLDAIGENNQAGPDLERPEQREAQANPAGRELVQIQSRAMEEVTLDPRQRMRWRGEEAVVGLAPETKDADEADPRSPITHALAGGDACQVHAAAEAHEHQG